MRLSVAVLVSAAAAGTPALSMVLRNDTQFSHPYVAVEDANVILPADPPPTSAVRLHEGSQAVFDEDSNVVIPEEDHLFLDDFENEHVFEDVGPGGPAAHSPLLPADPPPTTAICLRRDEGAQAEFEENSDFVIPEEDHSFLEDFKDERFVEGVGPSGHAYIRLFSDQKWHTFAFGKFIGNSPSGSQVYLGKMVSTQEKVAIKLQSDGEAAASELFNLNAIRYIRGHAVFSKSNGEKVLVIAMLFPTGTTLANICKGNWKWWKREDYDKVKLAVHLVARHAFAPLLRMGLLHKDLVFENVLVRDVLAFNIPSPNDSNFFPIDFARAEVVDLSEDLTFKILSALADILRVRPQQDSDQQMESASFQPGTPSWIKMIRGLVQEVLAYSFGAVRIHNPSDDEIFAATATVRRDEQDFSGNDSIRLYVNGELLTYELGKRIGTGDECIGVFLGRRLFDGSISDVAIKIEEEGERAQNEQNHLSWLSYNLGSVVYQNTESGKVMRALAMPLVEGRSLLSLAQWNAISWANDDYKLLKEAFRLFARHGLAPLLRRGFLHKNFHFGNIFVSRFSGPDEIPEAGDRYWHPVDFKEGEILDLSMDITAKIVRALAASFSIFYTRQALDTGNLNSIAPGTPAWAEIIKDMAVQVKDYSFGKFKMHIPTDEEIQMFDNPDPEILKGEDIQCERGELSSFLRVFACAISYCCPRLQRNTP